MEQKILSALINDRESFDKVDTHLSQRDFGVDGGVILDEIRQFYAADEGAVRVDLDVLKARIGRRINNDKISGQICRIVDSLPSVSAPNIVREVLELHAQNAGLELAQSISRGSSIREIRPLLSKYNELVARDSFGEESQELANVSVSELVEKNLSPDGLIKIAPKSLNDRLDGGARRGHHILVFAPTEMGKTLMMVNMTYGFLKQGLKVLYVGNEDPANDILMRIICRMSGMNKFEVKENVEKAQKLADEAGYSNLIFADLAPGTFSRINSLVEKFKPDVVILDQLSNIDTSQNVNESKTNSLEQAAKLARQLAKSKFVLVVSVCQAADSATGKIVLGRGDVHNSNVGIPGQCDAMIGIGANADMEARGLREFTLVKNKLSGNHDHFSVRFNTPISRVEEA